MKKLNLNKPWLAITLALLLGMLATAIWMPSATDDAFPFRTLMLWSGGLLSALSGFACYWYRDQSKEAKQEHEVEVLYKQDVKTINQMFIEAIKQLKGQRVNKLQNMYELPWYVLIGGEKDAKSSLLQQNNLEPVLHRTLDESDTEQYLRFWSNDHLVVVEVGHRLFDDSGIDDRLWRVFAQQLSKYRPRQAVNGIITAIGCDRLLQGDKKARLTLSSNLQESILALGEHTGLSLPVYTVFTKSDSIADFVDFFTSYSGCDLDNPFGVTLPFNENNRFDSRDLKKECDAILANLAQQQFQLLRESREEESKSVIALPYQLRVFFERANELLTYIGRENRVRQSVWLRGMYLLTTGQKEISFDLLTQLVADKTAFNAEGIKHQQQGRKSLFATRIFSHVILPESKIVGVNERRHYGYLALRSLMVMCVVSGVVLFGLQLRDNWSEDEAFREKAITQLSLYRSDIDRLRDGFTGLEEVTPVLNELRLVAQEGNQPLSWYDKVSFKQTQTAEDIYQSYQKQLQVFLLPQLEEILSSELYVYVNLGNPSKVFELLRYYQMLFDKQRLDQSEMINYLVDTLNDQGDISASNINNLSQLMVDLFSSDYQNVLKSNDELVSVAVQNLEGLSPERLIYARVKSMPEYRNRVDIRRQLGDKFDALFQFKDDFHGYLLPELFTRQGHSKIDLTVKSALLKKQYDEFKSIQGDMSGASVAELSELSKKIQRLYYADYVYQWKELVKNIEVKDFTSVYDLASAIKIAREPANSPLIDVLDAVIVNTTLAAKNDTDTRANAKAANQLGLKKLGKQLRKVDKINRVAGDDLVRLQPSFVVNEAFSRYASFMAIQGKSKSAPIDELMLELDNLNTYFDAALTSSEPQRALYTNAKAHAAGSQDALVNFRRQSSKAPGQVADWIKNLDKQAWKGVIEGGVGFLNQQWDGQVYHFYREAVEGRFPFALQGRGEVAIDDFAAMFKPQGRLDTFITKQLQPFVYWDNNTLKLAEVDGRKLPIKPETLIRLNQAKKISTIFFGPTGQQLAVKLKFKASSMSTSATQFSVRENENVFSYRHGPRLWSQVVWPSIGENDYMSANFYNGENRIATKSYTGQWALFRMLFDGSTSATGDRRVRKLHYGLEDQSIVFEYALDSSNSVLDKRLLNNFHLSANL